MFQNNRLFKLLFILLISGLVACVAEDGDTGPVGPVGPPGPANGPQGPRGPAGEDGKDGTDANIQAFTFTVLNGDYEIFSNSTGTFYMHRDTINLTEITSDVVDNGTVQIFRKETSASSWTAMPYYRGGISYNYSYDVGNVYIEVSYNNPNPINIGDSDFKIVVIPTPELRRGINIKNHQLLEALYGI